MDEAGRTTSEDCRTAAVRCSANVVLLAHGYRSLHVLAVQRSQLTAMVGGRYRNRRMSAAIAAASPIVVRYKL